ncbi:MAG: hypothetical protein RSC60_06050 [Christensenellaceae bacterium]
MWKINNRTRYTYDDAGNIKESINGSRKTVYEYDKLGRVVQVTLPDHGKQTYAYDAVGNVALQRLLYRNSADSGRNHFAAEI